LIGGIRFYDRKEIKNLLYLLKIICNPDDKECLRRWLDMDRMGIGDKGFEKLSEIADEEQKNVLDILPDYIHLAGSRINKANQEKIDSYIKTFNYLKNYQDNISFLSEQLVKKINYYNLIKDKDDQIKTESKVENVKAFLQSIREYKKQNSQSKLDDFLSYISLLSNVDSSDKSVDSDVVNLMTLHCAKGLEFPVVFLTGLEEGIFPHNRSFSSQIDLEEERRLCYVGMTRAMDILYFTYSWQRNVDGKTQFNKLSRFFTEIPKKYLEKTIISTSCSDLNPHNDRNISNENRSIDIDDNISHPDWGKGLIISKKEAGDDCYVTVNFKTYGIKRLSLKYAPIKKIEKNS